MINSVNFFFIDFDQSTGEDYFVKDFDFVG